MLELDLVDEMQWEDVVICISLEEAGLEEDSSWQPVFGEGSREIPSGGVPEYVDWFLDGNGSGDFY